MRHSAALIIAEITLLLIGHTLIGQLAQDKKESRLKKLCPKCFHSHIERLSWHVIGIATFRVSPIWHLGKVPLFRYEFLWLFIYPCYPDMSSALEPSGCRRFTTVKERRQALRAPTGRLPECSDRLHTPRLIPKITDILITPTIPIFHDTACE